MPDPKTGAQQAFIIDGVGGLIVALSNWTASSLHFHFDKDHATMLPYCNTWNTFLF